MSFVEVSGFIFSPIIGLLLEKLGRKNIIVWGFVIITLGTVGLGLCDLIPGQGTDSGDLWFFIAALICRFIQGTGDQFVQTTTYSVLSSVFPETREKVLGYAETAAGIGLMIGPVIGGGMNAARGYLFCYMAFSCMLAVVGVVTFILLPNSLNAKPVVTQ
jgi:MFS family permease